MKTLLNNRVVTAHNRSARRGLLWLIPVALLALRGADAPAANRTWDGGGSDNNWGTAANWNASPIESVYIPVKEMLANAPGFRSLYAQREIHFESIYADIIDRAAHFKLCWPADAQGSTFRYKRLHPIKTGAQICTEADCNGLIFGAALISCHRFANNRPGSDPLRRARGQRRRHIGGDGFIVRYCPIIRVELLRMARLACERAYAEQEANGQFVAERP